MKVLIASAAGIVALLALLYGVNAYLTWSAERASPPQGSFHEVDGIRLHYVMAGEGVPLLLLHGANGSLGDFTASVFDRLARRYRVIAVDRPGHGYSGRPASPLAPGEQARLIHGLVRDLGIERPIVVGFSFGSGIALAYGLDFPDDVRAVVALAPVAFEWPDEIDWKWRMPTWPVLGRLLVDTVPQIMGRLVREGALRNAFAPESVASAYGEGPYDLMLRPAQFRANAEDIRLLKPFLRGLTPRYPGLRPPLVILTGDTDRVVSPTIHSRQLHAAVRDSELTIIPGAGHLLPYTRPEDVERAIERAVSKTER